MKHFSSVFFALFLLAFSACTKSNSGNEQGVFFKIVTSSVDFDMNSGEKEIEFTAPGAWTAESGDDSWCTITPTSGNGSGKITVSVSENESGDPRSTKVSFTCGGLTLSSTVNQEGNPDALSITPSSIEIEAQASDFSIVVKSSKEYDVTLVDSWISIVSREGAPATGETINFHAEENPVSEDGAARMGIVSICTKDGSCIPVKVNQKGQFSRKVLAMRFTAQWCGWCPYMDETFHKAAELEPKFDYLTIHCDPSYELYFTESGTLADAYNIQGYPSGVIAGWKSFDNNTNTDNAAKSVKIICNDFDTRFPNSVGIKATATFEGNRLTAHADIYSNETEELKVVAIVTEDGVVARQALYGTDGSSSTINDFVHDRIARKTLTASIMGDTISAEAGKAVSMDWNCAVASSWNKENLSVLVYVYKEYKDIYRTYKKEKKFPDYYIVNSSSVPVE